MRRPSNLGTDERPKKVSRLLDVGGSRRATEGKRTEADDRRGGQDLIISHLLATILPGGKGKFNAHLTASSLLQRTPLYRYFLQHCLHHFCTKAALFDFDTSHEFIDHILH